MNGPTLGEIRTWPATVDIATAATALGISRSYGYELARTGGFPAKVLRVGGKRRVVTADLLRALGDDERRDDVRRPNVSAGQRPHLRSASDRGSGGDHAA